MQYYQWYTWKPTVNYMPYNRFEQLRTVHNILWHGNYFPMFLIKAIAKFKRMIVSVAGLVLKWIIWAIDLLYDYKLKWLVPTFLMMKFDLLPKYNNIKGSKKSKLTKSKSLSNRKIPHFICQPTTIYSHSPWTTLNLSIKHHRTHHTRSNSIYYATR